MIFAPKEFQFLDQNKDKIFNKTYGKIRQDTTRGNNKKQIFDEDMKASLRHKLLMVIFYKKEEKHVQNKGNHRRI